MVLTSYGKNQRRDHDQYDRLNDPPPPLKTEGIPLQSEPWVLPDGGKPKQGYRHLRQQSSISMSDVLNQPSQQPIDSMSMTTTSYDYQPYNDEYHPSPPTHNRTRTASPTPTNNYHYNPQVTSYIQPAMQSQPPRKFNFLVLHAATRSYFRRRSFV